MTRRSRPSGTRCPLKEEMRKKSKRDVVATPSPPKANPQPSVPSVTIVAPDGRGFVVPLPLDRLIKTLRNAASFALFNHRDGLEYKNPVKGEFWRPGLTFEGQLLTETNGETLGHFGVIDGSVLYAVKPNEVPQEGN